MSKEAENMLVDGLINGARYNHIDRVLDARQRSIINERNSVLTKDVIDKSNEIMDLNRKVRETDEELREANEEKKKMNREMREMMRINQQNVGAAEDWMRVLRLPLHEIARVSPEFAKNYNQEKFESAKIYLQKLVNEYATRDLADRVGMTPEKLLIFKCNIESAILSNDDAIDDSYKIDNIPELKQFKEPLINDYRDREQQYQEFIKNVNKTAKTFK